MTRRYNQNVKILTDYDKTYQMFADFDAPEPLYLDGKDVDLFKILDQQYPDSLFILNIRNVNEWLKSRLFHCGKYG